MLLCTLKMELLKDLNDALDKEMSSLKKQHLDNAFDTKSTTKIIWKRNTLSMLSDRCFGANTFVRCSPNYWALQMHDTCNVALNFLQHSSRHT